LNALSLNLSGEESHRAQKKLARVTAPEQFDIRAFVKTHS
jgi:hypothetical protein